MIQSLRLLVVGFAIVVAGVVPPAAAQSSAPTIGIVVMHGKGGSPTGYVADLAGPLQAKGYLVANLEMPWSRRRGYDVDVATADKEVEAAIAGLRAKGAASVFVAGHSQGGLYALHFGSKHAVNGIIAIAPGGNVANRLYAMKLGDTVERARQLVAAGKGDERAEFYDYEGSKGKFPVTTTAAIYLSWFDPDGAMNQSRASKNMNPNVPVLFIAPTRDYPGLLKVRDVMYGSLPSNPMTRLYEPDSNHVKAPPASLEEIVRWTGEVADKAKVAVQGTQRP